MLAARHALRRRGVVDLSRAFATSCGLHQQQQPPPPAPAASSSESAPATDAAPGLKQRRGPRSDDPWDIQNLEAFKFDDTTSYGHWVLEKRREQLELHRAVERDRELLQKQRKEFKPPTSSQYLRFSSFVSLTSSNTFQDPSLAQTQKRSLQVPIDRLPLRDADAIHRFKLLAGTRWIPPKQELEPAAATRAIAKKSGDDHVVAHGWFKMSEDSFPDGRMNRKWLSDVLEKVVEEANSTSSPLASASASVPLDVRHALARQRKKKGRDLGGHNWNRREARLKSGSGGGVPGFPAAWLWDGAKSVGATGSRAQGQRGISTMGVGRRSYSTNARRLEEIASNEGVAEDLIAPETTPAAESTVDQASSSAETSQPPHMDVTKLMREVTQDLPTPDESDSAAVTSQSDLAAWQDRSKSRRAGQTGNQYTGRSVTVFQPRAGASSVEGAASPSAAAINSALRRLNIVLSRNKIKKELRLGEFYEKPSERRQRLARERHRRRFQDMVRKKVQLVQQLRSRP